MRIRPFHMILSLLMAGSVFLSACGKPAATVSETGGVERAVVQQSAEALKPLETEAEEETREPMPTDNPSVDVTEPSASLVDGKYVYAIPEPDRSSLSDLSDVNALSKALFSDAGQSTDWYYGKTERNLTTGEVTYVWDRAKDTLALLDKYDAVYRKNEEEKVVYFTFDCGYENGWTEPILDVLKEKNVPGLFFVVGHYVETAPDIIKRMYEEGHLVGNHTYNHPNMATGVTADEFIKEITSLEDALDKIFPDAPPTLYWRPPYGACNEWTLAMAKKLGLTTVLWSWAHYDYAENDQPDVAASLEKAKKGLHNGAVYLFHCVGSTNPAILGDLIDYIRAEGYEIRPMCN